MTSEAKGFMFPIRITNIHIPNPMSIIKRFKIQSSLVNPDAINPDAFSGERNFYSLFCIINPDIRVLDPNGHFLQQNIKMHRKLHR
jgi:hypothetical protein